MRITSKGQVTIPADIREKAGLLPHTDVEFVLEGRNVRLVSKKGGGTKQSRGDLLVSRLRGSGNIAMSTDEIMALTRKG